MDIDNVERGDLAETAESRGERLVLRVAVVRMSNVFLTVLKWP